jgi:ABC-2 type transport system permease protein
MAVWRRWLTLKRYKLEFITGIFSSVLFGVAMLTLALAFDPDLLEELLGTRNWAAFMILGLVYQVWQGVALWRTAGMFRDELNSGQIDYTFTCPFSRYLYLLSNIAALAVIEAIGFFPMFAVALALTRATVKIDQLLLGFAATALSVAALAQMGTFFAGLVLRYREVNAVFSLLNFAFQMMTGMFVPLQVLPAAVRVVGIALLPQSFGIDLLRHYVMDTRTVIGVPYEWAILTAQFVVFGIFATLSVKHLERSAREEGLHYL